MAWVFWRVDSADPETVSALATLVAEVLDDMRRTPWFDDCCHPLYAHLEADAWRLNALLRQRDISEAELNVHGVRRHLHQWLRLVARDAAVETELRELLEEES